MMIHKIEPHKYYPEFEIRSQSLPIICCYLMEKKYFCPPIQKTTLLLRVLPRMKVL